MPIPRDYGAGTVALRYTWSAMDNIDKSVLRPPPPVLVAHLFPELLDGLLTLLGELTSTDWDRPTICAEWSVKDIPLHLLGVEVGNLSRRRDGHKITASAEGRNDLVALINDWNQRWVEVTRRISPQLLIDLMQVAGVQMCDYFRSRDPHTLGGAVSWAGPEPAPVWLDIAREYTERWHHQQHLRDAVGRPGYTTPRYLAPVLATFVRALPRALESAQSADNTIVALTITGESGGRWVIRREDAKWRLYENSATQPAAEVVIDEDAAWRLFTRGLSPRQARERAQISGDEAPTERILAAVAIIG